MCKWRLWDLNDLCKSIVLAVLYPAPLLHLRRIPALQGVRYRIIEVVFL